MLDAAPLFDGLAADFACATLLGTRAGGLIGRVGAGEHWLEV